MPVPHRGRGRGLALLRDNNVTDSYWRRHRRAVSRAAAGLAAPTLCARRLPRRAIDGVRPTPVDRVRVIDVPDRCVVGADQLLDRALVPEGPLGEIRPDAQSAADIEHGLRIARALGGLDVGQAVIVQQGLVLGVEAIEGTDELLRRCAALRRDGPGGVLVKVEKPGQERRADRPTIGLRTVTLAAETGLRGIAIEADATIVLDRDEVIRAADRTGLFVVGVGRL